MNDRNASSYLHEATSELTPDVERLVAGGLSRGRSRRRRQRAGAALATVAVFGVIGTVASVSLIGGGDDDGRGVDVANAPTSTPSTPSSPAPTKDPGPAVLAVTSSTAPDVFEQVVGGTVTKLPLAGNDDSAAPNVDFQWNGYATRIAVTPDDYLNGTSMPDPMKRCEAQEEEFACAAGPDGIVVATADFTGPEVDGANTVRLATVYRPDGWDVLAMVSNAATKEGKPLSAEPPLTVAQLVDIASSDAWFE